MTRKSLFVLAVLALSLVAGWYFTSQVGLPKAPARAEVWLPGLQAPQVETIEIQRVDQPLVRLQRSESGWVLPDKADYPADQAAAAKLLKALIEARKVEPRTANPELYGRLGLADKGEPRQQGVRVTLKLSGQPPLALLIGNPGQQSGQLVRRADQAQSWLVSQRIELPATELEWLDRRITTVPYSSMRELQLRHANGERLTLFRDEAEDAHFQVRELPKGKLLAFDGAADGMARFFVDLRFADAAPLAQLTFEGKPVLQFSLTTFAGKTLKGSLFSQADQYWLLFDKDSDLPATELPGRTDWAYRVESYQYQSLAKKLTELLAAN
jgi:hypothetical protein